VVIEVTYEEEMSFNTHISTTVSGTIQLNFATSKLTPVMASPCYIRHQRA